jgi:hypothetical protein
MAKYGELVYGTGVKYGEASRNTLTAEPLSSAAIDYQTVDVYWAKPSGAYSAFRIVRNQTAFPETEEDGKVVYEWYVPQSGPEDRSATPFKDTGSSLVSGRFVYYRAWLLVLASGEWIPAGQTFTLLPSRHLDKNSKLISSDTHDRFMSYFPRVLVTETNSSVDEINKTYNPLKDASGAEQNSLISTFFQGFSFTVDEFMTFAEKILPTPSMADSSPSILALQSLQVGMPLDPQGTTREQKRLVRNAVKMYKSKGTVKSLSEFSEAMTGFAPTLTPTPNLLLSVQDSTFNLPSWFEGSVGMWIPGDDITLSVDSTQAPATEVYSLDNIFTGKIVSASTNTTLELGTDYPITRGIPVTEGKYYQLSLYTQSLSGTAKITPTINWFDKDGAFISSASGSDITAGTSWGTRDYTNVLAPVGSVWAGFTFTFNTSTTYWIDMVSFSKVDAVDTVLQTYYEPRGITVFLNPSKTNYINNPSWEENVNNWSYSGGTTTTITSYIPGSDDGPVGARFGNKYLAYTSLGSGQTYLSNAVSVPSNSYYTFSIYAKAPSALSGILKLSWVDGSTPVTVSKDVSLTTSWQRLFITISLPKKVDEDGVLTNVELTSRLEGNWAGAVLKLDAAQLEPSYSYTDYFDGNVAGVSWAGTINLSSSYSYPRRDIKLKRFANYIEEFLPLNTPYYIDYYSDTPGDIKYSGIS